MPQRAPSIRPPPDSRPKNRLLAFLPAEDFERLRPHLRTVPVHHKHVFYAIGESIRDVIFLNGGVASVTTVMKDGTTVELAAIGYEGVLGIEALFGADVATGECILQVPDTDAEYLPLPSFRAEVARRGPFFDGMQRFSQGMITLLMQSTACVALHTVRERCARWLLMTHDRVQRDDFHLSQEFLAIMLGSTRPTVSVVAATLQRGGLIQYKHGHITVLDRLGLEQASCECYETVRARFDQLGL